MGLRREIKIRIPLFNRIGVSIGDLETGEFFLFEMVDLRVVRTKGFAVPDRNIRRILFQHRARIKKTVVPGKTPEEIVEERHCRSPQTLAGEPARNAISMEE